MTKRRDSVMISEYSGSVMRLTAQEQEGPWSYNMWSYNLSYSLLRSGSAEDAAEDDGAGRLVVDHVDEGMIGIEDGRLGWPTWAEAKDRGGCRGRGALLRDLDAGAMDCIAEMQTLLAIGDKTAQIGRAGEHLTGTQRIQQWTDWQLSLELETRQAHLDLPIHHSVLQQLAKQLRSSLGCQAFHQLTNAILRFIRVLNGMHDRERGQ